MKTKLLALTLLSYIPYLVSPVNAQNLGVNTLTPDASAILDITHTSRGLLIPRLPLTSTTDVTTITSPALSLLVFNTATAGISPNDVKPGYYYWDGSKWVGIGGDSWRLTGNAGTSAGTDFLGTIDAQDLIFKTNSVENMRILNTNGNVGIGTTTPLSQLHIDGGAANSLLNVGTAGQRQLIMGNRNSTAALLNGGLGAYSSIMAANGEMRFGLTEQVNPLAIQYATFMTIQNNGNVGIGTVTPTEKLEIAGKTLLTNGFSATNAALIYKDNTDYLFLGPKSGSTTNGATIGLYGSTNNEASAPNPGGIDLSVVGSSPALRIVSTGNVGIGTTTPTQKLDIAGSIKITDGSEGIGKVLTSDAVGKGTWVANIPQNYIGTIAASTTYGPSYPTSTDLGDQVVISTPGTYMIVYQRYFTKVSGGTNDFHLQLSDNNFATVLSDVTLQVTPQNVWFQGSIIQIQTYTVPTTLKGGYALFAGSYNSISNGSCMFAIRLQ